MYQYLRVLVVFQTTYVVHRSHMRPHLSIIPVSLVWVGRTHVGAAYIDRDKQLYNI